MIKLGNGLQDAYAVIPLELTLKVKTHEEHSIKVARSKTASAHTRTVQHRLDEPLLEGVLKFITTAKLIPGRVYADQQQILYIALDAQIFSNVDRNLGVSNYALPEFLLQVSETNVEKRTQFTM